MICVNYGSEESERKFVFAVATKRDGTDKKSIDSLPIFESLNRMRLDGVFVSVIVFDGNSDGLGKLYNKVMDNEANSKFGYFVFVHDDVWLNDVLIFDKIADGAKNADILGICGGKSWNPYGDGKNPIIWTHASASKGMSGFMVHAADAKQDSKSRDMLYRGRSIFASNYGNSPSRVLTIDGCFMCFTRKAVDMGIRFDERFSFHFYDMDVCFTAYVRKAVIATAPILVTHESLGYSVMQPQFMESQRAFMEKWFGQKNG